VEGGDFSGRKDTSFAPKAAVSRAEGDEEERGEERGEGGETATRVVEIGRG
jgi:hypothetical protein